MSAQKENLVRRTKKVHLRYRQSLHFVPRAGKSAELSAVQTWPMGICRQSISYEPHGLSPDAGTKMRGGLDGFFYKSSSRYRYANWKSAFLRFILRIMISMRRESELNENLPRGFIIEKTICALFVVLVNLLWLFVSLKPGLILLVKPPTLCL